MKLYEVPQHKGAIPFSAMANLSSFLAALLENSGVNGSDTRGKLVHASATEAPSIWGGFLWDFAPFSMPVFRTLGKCKLCRVSRHCKAHALRRQLAILAGKMGLVRYFTVVPFGYIILPTQPVNCIQIIISFNSPSVEIFYPFPTRCFFLLGLHPFFVPFPYVPLL